MQGFLLEEKLCLPDSHLGFADRLLLAPSGQPGNSGSMLWNMAILGDDGDADDEEEEDVDDEEPGDDITGVTSTAAKARAGPDIYSQLEPDKGDDVDDDYDNDDQW